MSRLSHTRYEPPAPVSAQPSVEARMICVTAGTGHTVEKDLFIESQLASRNELEGLMRLKFGHVKFNKLTQRNPRSPPCGAGPFRFNPYWNWSRYPGYPGTT